MGIHLIATKLGRIFSADYDKSHVPHLENRSNGGEWPVIACRNKPWVLLPVQLGSRVCGINPHHICL